MAIKIIVNGASGRMGTEAVKAISNDTQLELVASLTRKDDLTAQIQKHNADVVVDFTVASVVNDNITQIINAGARAVVGTSGLLPEQIKSLQQQCLEKKLGCIIAPNFSIGAVLMMRYAQDAAKYLNHVEIVELHHDGKEDSPSGTAIKTADMIAEVRQDIADISSRETIPGSRGAIKNNIHIHALRLPGLVAHQQVIFGGVGETLTIRHDSINRECFMPGVLLACKKVMETDELVYGLEHII